MPNFEESFAPDEYYFATALAALGRPPLQRVANRAITWTDWSKAGKHPEEFRKVSSQMMAMIAESGCFFARKFASDSNAAQFGLHREKVKRALTG
ncbi:beta-1,6-N-acetylglucosaminyltransferase [Akkermansiaceae bacterium]|nr:beta-1,6-N-acetylglucosaminyltransferase [Akkermansiaceae bacterium]